MRTRFRLSASKVKALARKPGRHGDGGGLILQVVAVEGEPEAFNAGWLFRYQRLGKERWMGLGALRDVGLGEARSQADAARRLVVIGIDPIEQRKAARQQTAAEAAKRVTFRSAFEKYVEGREDGWRAKHLSQWRNSVETYCKALMGVAVSDIDTGMVLKVLEAHWSRIPTTMNRVRTRIGEVLAFAQVHGWRPQGTLPTEWSGHLEAILTAPTTLQAVEHHPAMPFADVPALYQRLIGNKNANFVPVPEWCLAFTLLTATRSVEARGAKRSEIDFAKKLWTVPASRMKRKKPHVVPLSDEAIRLIEALPNHGGNLFSMTQDGKPITAMTLRKALHRNGGKDYTVHGLRSSFRDWGNECTHHAREVLEHALAHVVGPASERSYSRSDMVAKRRIVMREWADVCTGRKAVVIVNADTDDIDTIIDAAETEAAQ